ncbi:MAG: nitrous oxide reductase accessory protein NosL [Bacteroidetes bacterium]|nr:nitrous oxide reductase accessory protein NosL [Bacteroidota bacterium]
MKKEQVPKLVRFLMLICAAALTVVLFVPMWRIELDAPQYPEGLTLLIFANKLGGNVDIVNGLNHYIGMKTLHAADFIEFTLLPYFVGFFAIFALLVALFARPKLLYFFFFLFMAFAVLSMVDFWRWEYNYGHDLNPDAAIIVPGMSYQPPLIGFKQLLNFGAFSIPDIGGWIFISVGLIGLISVIMTSKNNRRPKYGPFILTFIVSSLLGSCNAGPEPLKFGTDNCFTCKMTISDQRFGAEIITKKGRILKFDDSYCMLAYLKTKELPLSEIQNIYMANFTGKHQLLKVEEAVMLQSNTLRGPMGGNLVASDQIDSINKMKENFPGNNLLWAEILKQ